MDLLAGLVHRRREADQRRGLAGAGEPDVDPGPGRSGDLVGPTVVGGRLGDAELGLRQPLHLDGPGLAGLVGLGIVSDLGGRAVGGVGLAAVGRRARTRPGRRGGRGSPLPVVAVVDEAPFPLLAVVELESGSVESGSVEPASGSDGSPAPESSAGAVVVVALAGPCSAAGDGCAARTGENARSPTMPAANGNRNRRCMAAS